MGINFCMYVLPVFEPSPQIGKGSSKSVCTIGCSTRPFQIADLCRMYRSNASHRFCRRVVPWRVLNAPHMSPAYQLYVRCSVSCLAATMSAFRFHTISSVAPYSYIRMSQRSLTPFPLFHSVIFRSKKMLTRNSSCPHN